MKHMQLYYKRFFLFFVITICLCFQSVVPVFAENEISGCKDNTVPLRFVTNEINAQLDWNNDEKSINIHTNKETFKLIIGSKIVFAGDLKIFLADNIELVGNSTIVTEEFLEKVLHLSMTCGRDGTINIISVFSNPKLKYTIEEIGSTFIDTTVMIQMYDEQNNKIGSASGTIVNNQGEIVSNYHILDNCDHLKIIFQDNTSEDIDTLQSVDPNNDLFLVKVNKQLIHPIKINKAKNISIGETVVTIGSPLGLQGSLSSGVISHPLRTINGRELIQISAPISHGNSGGALLDLDGNLMGITSDAADGATNINFAIPFYKVLDFLSVKRESIKIKGITEHKEQG